MTTQVLVVEDNEEMLQLLSLQLQFFGYQVMAAKNGLEAVTIAVSRLPNLIVMDVSMPKMNGTEAVAQLRSNPKTREIPILAATGWAFPNNKQRYLASGFDDYLVKPFTHTDLHNAIGKLLGNAGKASDT